MESTSFPEQDGNVNPDRRQPVFDQSPNTGLARTTTHESGQDTKRSDTNGRPLSARRSARPPSASSRPRSGQNRVERTSEGETIGQMVPRPPSGPRPRSQGSRPSSRDSTTGGSAATSPQGMRRKSSSPRSEQTAAQPIRRSTPIQRASSADRLLGRRQEHTGSVSSTPTSPSLASRRRFSSVGTVAPETVEASRSGLAAAIEGVRRTRSIGHLSTSPTPRQAPSDDDKSTASPPTLNTSSSSRPQSGLTARRHLASRDAGRPPRSPASRMGSRPSSREISQIPIDPRGGQFLLSPPTGAPPVSPPSPGHRRRSSLVRSTRAGHAAGATTSSDDDWSSDAAASSDQWSSSTQDTRASGRPHSARRQRVYRHTAEEAHTVSQARDSDLDLEDSEGYRRRSKTAGSGRPSSAARHQMAQRGPPRSHSWGSANVRSQTGAHATLSSSDRRGNNGGSRQDLEADSSAWLGHHSSHENGPGYQQHREDATSSLDADDEQQPQQIVRPSRLQPLASMDASHTQDNYDDDESDTSSSLDGSSEDDNDQSHPSHAKASALLSLQLQPKALFRNALQNVWDDLCDDMDSGATDDGFEPSSFQRQLIFQRDAVPYSPARLVAFEVAGHLDVPILHQAIRDVAALLRCVRVRYHPDRNMFRMVGFNPDATEAIIVGDTSADGQRSLTEDQTLLSLAAAPFQLNSDADPLWRVAIDGAAAKTSSGLFAVAAAACIADDLSVARLATSILHCYASRLQGARPHPRAIPLMPPQFQVALSWATHQQREHFAQMCESVPEFSQLAGDPSRLDATWASLRLDPLHLTLPSGSPSSTSTNNDDTEAWLFSRTQRLNSSNIAFFSDLLVLPDDCPIPSAQLLHRALLVAVNAAALSLLCQKASFGIDFELSAATDCPDDLQDGVFGCLSANWPIAVNVRSTFLTVLLDIAGQLHRASMVPPPTNCDNLFSTAVAGCRVRYISTSESQAYFGTGFSAIHGCLAADKASSTLVDDLPGLLFRRMSAVPLPAVRVDTADGSVALTLTLWEEPASSKHGPDTRSKASMASAADHPAGLVEDILPEESLSEDASGVDDKLCFLCRTDVVAARHQRPEALRLASKIGELSSRILREVSCEPHISISKLARRVTKS